jgi:xylulokinase
MLLAVDLGTTNCKALVLDPACRVVESARFEYPISTPRQDWAEQDPELWWGAVRQAIRAVASRVDSASIRAIGLSGQMHGLVALDGQGRVLRPAILWNDQRAESQCRDVYAAVGGPEALAALTDNAMLPGYVGGKLLWLREHEPEIFAQVRSILLPKDYIRYRLSGERCTDFSDASGTGLLDVRRRTWASGLLDTLGIPSTWLPTCLDAQQVAGQLLAGVAAELGLPAGIPVVAGGGDAVMQTVGAGVLTDEEVLVVIGTGGNVTTTVRECPQLPAPNAQVFCHVIPGAWVTMGVTLNAGNALRWYRDLSATEGPAPGGGRWSGGYGALADLAGGSPPGARGLVFLPYLQGERCPYADQNARGTLIGLSLRTREAEIVRSIMEGVAFSLFDVFEVLARRSGSRGRVVASGGGATSAVWRQILADVFAREVVTRAAGEDASALGAAIVAGVAVGVWKSAEEAAAQIPQTSVLEPIPANARRYRELFQVYRSLYSDLKRSFDALSAFAGASPG